MQATSSVPPHGATHIKRSSTSSKKLTLSDAKRTIQENLDEVDRLQQLTDGLLRLLSRDSQVQIIDFKLQDAIGTALAAVAPKAASKRIAVNDQTPSITIRADQGALTQVLTILIDNAVKYSPEDSTITLTATVDDKQGVSISVADTGIGISEQDAQHIFSRFYRADSSRSQTEGYGLGLPIAHKLIKAHHGTLSVESAPGEGSIFTVRLPHTSR